MIAFTTEPCNGTRVVHLAGDFAPTDDPVALVDHLAVDGGSEPLVLDLAGLTKPTGPEVEILLATLARAPLHAATVLVHPDLETRRALRAAAGRLPVVPSNDLVLHGRFAAAIAAHEKPEEA